METLAAIFILFAGLAGFQGTDPKAKKPPVERKRHHHHNHHHHDGHHGVKIHKAHAHHEKAGTSGAGVKRQPEPKKP